MEAAMSGILLFIFCYLVGSIPFGVIVARRKNLDITKIGSGNIGATNVLRALGTSSGAAVLFLDTFKGFLPTYMGSRIVVDSPPVAVVCGLLAILGHLFPVFLKFKGGKGVATSLGVLIALDPQAAFLAFFVWLFFVLITKYVSLGSLCAALFVPLFFFANDSPGAYKLFGAAGALFVIIKHRQNIKRLLSRTESKISFSKKQDKL